MKFQTLGDKKEKIIQRVKNAETTLTIAKGTPVILTMTGTDDGLAVVLPRTAGQAKANAFIFGVALDDIVAGAMGDVQSWGVCDYVKLCVQSRSQSTGANTIPTADTVALGAMLLLVTDSRVGDCFSTVADTVAAASNADQTLTRNNNAIAFLGQSIASAAAIATSTSETRLAVTQAVKAFLRMM